MPGSGTRALVAAATALALLVLVALLARTVSDPREAVRMRDSLLASPGAAADFDWTPRRYPEGFLRTSAPPSPLIAEASRRVVTATDTWSRALQIARHLGEVPNREEPIQHLSDETYRIMFTEGGGYCADFTEVFMAMAVAAGVPAREWGIAFDGFGGDGHAVVEVYDEIRGKWLMVDPFNSFYPADAATGEPLSVLEFRERLTGPGPLATLRIVRIAPEVDEFPYDDRLVAYFQRGVDQFYLWWGDNIFDYEQHPVVAAFSGLGRTAEQGLAILAGVHPRIVMYPTGGNEALMAGVAETRRHTLGYLAGIVILAVLLLIQGVLWVRARRR